MGILTHIIRAYSPFTPIPFILVSIALSRWWDIINNALSDLGHPNNSIGAIIFNIGLVLGGYLMAIQSALILKYTRSLESFLISIIGLSLILVGTLNESFGYAHFVVSVILFIVLATYITYSTIAYKIPWLVIGLIASILLWYLHFTLGIPRGAAIPELVSITTTYVAYLTCTFRKVVYVR